MNEWMKLAICGLCFRFANQKKCMGSRGNQIDYSTFKWYMREEGIRRCLYNSRFAFYVQHQSTIYYLQLIVKCVRQKTSTTWACKWSAFCLGTSISIICIVCLFGLHRGFSLLGAHNSRKYSFVTRILF